MNLSTRHFILLSLLTFLLFPKINYSQSLDEKKNISFPLLWEKVDSLENQGLYRLAINEVKTIFQHAIERKDHEQVIKSVLYELKFNVYLEEDDYVLGIYRIEELIPQTPSPSKEILHSILAEVYWGYYSSNSYTFSNRTSAVEIELNDIRTWDLKRIAKKIRYHYISSLLHETVLQSYGIEKFPELISNNYSSREIRPTLYDFLGHRALDFFKSNQFDLAGPAETFIVDQPDYFASNSSFLNLNVATKDSLNTSFLAMRIFHALTDFNQHKNNLIPLFYLELDRLAYVHSKSTLSDKDERYEAALNRLAETYKQHHFASEAWYEIAAYKFNEGYNPSGDANKKMLRKEAFKICENTIQTYPDTYGAQLCEALRSSILVKDISITAEEAIAPNQKNKFLLRYKNCDAVHLKIIKMDYDEANKLRNNSDKFYRELKRDNGVHSELLTLQNPLDYNEHSAEFLLPELDPGYYILVVSSDGSFERAENKGGFAFIPFWSTSMTIQNRKINHKNEVKILNRTSGEPIIKALVDVNFYEYNYSVSKYEKQLLGSFYSDNEGKIYIPELPGVNYRNYILTINYNDEHYTPGDNIGVSTSFDQVDNSINTHLFTDRTIYRPGQKIYYKGIVTQNDGKDRKLRKNYQSAISFYDSNRQLIETKIVTTNQFGSFEGYFEAPFGVLTGQMEIRTANSSKYIRVEEYKRPKFSVKMDPIEGEVMVNDEIKATGLAEAYAGNKIDGAKVTYRIQRNVQYNWGYWWRWYAPGSPKEIANGTTTTDENGVFEINFKALPDKTTDPKTLPVFYYTITAEVTDINGETHTTTSTVKAGYQSLELGQNIPSDFNTTADFYLRISTRNLNGQPINGQGTVLIEQLNTPETVLYDRLWEKPDHNTWSNEEFALLFPNQVYDAENEYFNWVAKKTVFASKFNTEKSDSLSLGDYSMWEPGVYRYTAKANDKNGIEVKDEFYFTVFSPKNDKAPTNELLWIKPLQSNAEPGDTVQLLLGTAAKNLHVSIETEANGALIESRSLELNKEQRALSFIIKDVYRGNFTIHISTVNNGRAVNYSHTIIVPYTNKMLDLSFTTFRNKLLPGADEEWMLTIKNRYGEKEEAELLATLYDASLDALYTPNSFFLDIYKTYYGSLGWSSPLDFSIETGNNLNYYWNQYVSTPSRSFPYLNHYGWSPYYYGPYNFYDFAEESIMVDDEISFDSNANEQKLKRFAPARTEGNSRGATGEYAVSTDSAVLRSGSYKDVNSLDKESGQREEITNDADLGEIKARANFNETAFFYPQLTTNENGEISIKFTIPESLTKWKFLGLAHTKELKYGTISEEVVTQKDLMVVPNVPRFLREGDRVTLSTKISNISEVDLEGKAQLILLDPFTDEEIGTAFNLNSSIQNFATKKGTSTVVSWAIDVPYTYSAIKYKFVAKAGDFSDGEENVLPVLSNRMLVTESLPLPIRGEETKTFNFKKLTDANLSTSLKHHNYTLEFTSNPAWYAIQAMPYMMEYPHECAEQTFTRYYSNVIASHIMNSNPKIKTIIEEWGQNSPEAFLSNLQKNEELKAVILEETPWVLDAKNEEESKRNLAVLLDMGRMSRELDKALAKTIQSQTSNGGWPWFPGMPESRFITQHIITGMGHLDHLGIKSIREDNQVQTMIFKGVQYLDRAIVNDFNYVKKWDKEYLIHKHIGYTQIQYLYARSYFPEIELKQDAKKAISYYKEQAEKYWLDFNIYAEGMIALAAHRFEMKTLANDIVKSLKDRSIQNEEMGMYWKDYVIGYNWYEAPIETQALMIEMFDEVTNDQATVDELKIWLLKQKQTTNWKTTKQTTEAVYALLLKGSNLLASDDLVAINVGGKAIEYVSEPAKDNPYQVKSQAGTGYFKTVWESEEVKPAMGQITISKKSKGVAWGAAYWQYFEDLDKITFAETNLKLVKQVYRVEVTNAGEELRKITPENPLQIGQKVRIRIELRTDRDLEYVHMKDMRAAGFEPIDVLSRYHYQGGLGYYQSTKDAATHFFFDYIRKGTYVFEYDLRVQHKGDFSNGITTIQCMYAPEFTAHSEGIRVSVK